MTGRIAAILGALALAPLAADAQSYRCISKDGKRYYGSTIPVECYGRPVEQLNSQGMVVKRIDPEGSEKERLAKQAADSKKREEDAASREVARRNHALLATYTSEKDIDDSRARALAENTKATREVESSIEAVRKRHSDYAKELDSYKGKNEPPARLRDDIKNAEDELKAQQQLLEVKKREVEQINARYDDDKKRYGALTVRR
jgi:chromosome segregation ATPase